MHRTGKSGDRGFTLIEITVGMLVFGFLLAIATPAWKSYSRVQQQRSASNEVVSVLRNAQGRATAEETVYRVSVDAVARTLTVDRAGIVQRTVTLVGNEVRISEVAFTNAAGLPATVYFTPRGTASPGRIVVSSQGRAQKRTITVEGLTGRVSVK